MSDKTWRPVVWLLLAVLLIPFAWIGFAKLLGVPLVPTTDSTGLLATIGGLMATIFTVGGLVIALVAVLTQLTLADRARLFMEEKYRELLPDLLNQAESRINAQILLRDARQAMRESLWQMAEDLMRRALLQNPELPEARSTLGLAMCAAIANRFRQDHGLAPIDLPLMPSAAGYVQRMDPPPLVDAVGWLQEAEEHGDTQEGSVPANLALMYGINQQADKMMQAVQRAVKASPIHAQIFDVEDLPLLAHGYARDLQIKESLATLGQLLDRKFPVARHDVQASIEQADFSDLPLAAAGLGWVVMGQWQQWMAGPRHVFPITIHVFARDTGLFQAMYVLPGKSTAEYIPPDDQMFLSAAELAVALDKLFVFLCPQ